MKKKQSLNKKISNFIYESFDLIILLFIILVIVFFVRFCGPIIGMDKTLDTNYHSTSVFGISIMVGYAIARKRKKK